MEFRVYLMGWWRT